MNIRYGAIRNCRGSLMGACIGLAIAASAHGQPASQADTAVLTGDATRPPLVFQHQAIGEPPSGRPRITNVQVVDLNRDGSNDVVVCDAQAQAVFWCHRSEAGEWQETQLAGDLIAPAHATIVDLDQDEDLDVLVSVMGNLYPDDGVIGSLVLLENDGAKFTKKVLLRDVRRVVDAQPGDFDGDGDLDLAVAVFGYLRGQVLWLENRGDGEFLDHELLYAPGTIHVPVADYDGDGDLDIAGIVSQDEEEAWGFENLGEGQFARHRLWRTANFDIGSAGLVKSDLDGDGDVDLLLPVGDNLEDSFSIPQPYHGCLWLENRGDWDFRENRLATFPGAYAAEAADLDADGDQDVMLCSMVNNWDKPDSASLVWLENDGGQHFTQRRIARDPIMLTTVACGDLDGDARPDIVAGGLHMFRPFDRLGRVSAWIAAEQNSEIDTVEDTSTPLAPESEAGDIPTPNLSVVDSLTRSDLEALREKLRERHTAKTATSGDWVELGNAYYAFGFFPEAKSCFHNAVGLDGSSFEANYLYGVSMARLGELSEAVDQFTKTLSIASNQQSPQVHYELGRCHLRMENLAQAEKAFASAGNHDHALFQLAKIRIRAGRTSAAAAPLNALSRRQRGTTELFLLSYRMAQTLGNAKQAQLFRDRSEYNTAQMPIDPVASMAKRIRDQYGVDKLGRQAEALIAEKKWDEAASLLEQIVVAYRDKDAVLLLATVEIERGHPESAIELLTSLMNDEGRFPQGMYVLGKAQLATGNFGEAERLWTATAELRSVGELHEELAKLYEEQGNEKAGNKQRALADQATGIAALRHGNPAAAIKYFQEAVELDKSLATSWFYLGECHRFLNDRTAARTAYETAVKLQPNHGRAHAALSLVAR